MSNGNVNGTKEPGFFNGGEINFSEPLATTIAGTTTEAVPENLNRKYLAVCNDSDEVMYLSFNRDAVMNRGIRLNANGGTLELVGPHIFTSAINAICASGSKELIYQEGY